MNRAGRNNGIYAAETILKQRTKEGKVWYLMKWKGYSPRFNTWEPEENVLDDRLLKAYRKRLAESRGKVKRKRTKPTEEENLLEDKSEIDVDVEGTESAAEAANDDEESREEVSDPFVEQPTVEPARKWRRRRKHNPDTSVTVKETETAEGNEMEGRTCSSLLTEADAIELKEAAKSPPTDTPTCSTGLDMAEPLSVSIQEEETTLKSPAQPPLEKLEVANSPQPVKTLDSPSSSSSSPPVDSGANVAVIAAPTLESPAQVSPELPPETSPATTIVERKPDVKVVQQEKKNVLSKSSHFDFLANSIIITDVTTERGTITVKECSAYGDFFGPDLDIPQ